MSARDALLKYHARQLGTARKKRKKNKKPEQQVVDEIHKWLKKHGFDCNTVEAKATWSEGGFYKSSTVAPGFSDIAGNDRNGFAVFIEAKAPGKRSTLRPSQREFLLRKIKTNCFAVVADSVGFLSTAYDEWCNLGGEEAQKYLFGLLPKTRSGDDDPLF
jgi:hypothetical protein